MEPRRSGSVQCLEDEPLKAANGAISFEDATLLEQCRRGDLSAVGPLIAKYQDRVYNTVWRLCGNAEDAADLTQEAFIKAMEAIGSFDGRSRFYTWVFRIAVNLALSHRRKMGRRRTVPLQGSKFADDENGGGMPEAWLPAAEPSPDEAALAGERQAAIAAALARLEEDQRSVVVLRDLEQFDYQQIAEILEIPVGTVKSKLHRARMALKELLGPALGLT